MAKEWAQLSYCTRKKVGSLIVKNGQIVSDGFNGSPSGFDNSCETEEGDTHWYVLHSEANAILKCAKNGVSCDGAVIYQTHSCCRDCAKLIFQAGIREVYYIEDYKDLSGLQFLVESGIKVTKLDIS